MDLDLRVVVKLLSPAAGWLRNEAVRWARTLSAAPYMSRNRTIDGFILKAQRVGDRATVHILDTPALVAIPGRSLVGAPGSAYLPVHSPVVSLAAGRAGMLNPSGLPPASLYPSHLGSPPLPQLVGGAIAPTASVIENSVQPSLSPMPGLGPMVLTCQLHMPAAYTVNPYAFVSRTNSSMVYVLSVFAPRLARGTYAQSPSGWLVDGASVPTDAPWAFVVSDSVLFSSRRVLPFCKRVSPPPYNPSSPAGTLFDNAQLPWGRAIYLGSGEVDGVPYYEVLVFVHVVTEMRNDDDRFGAKGLWVGRLRVRDPSNANGVRALLLQSTQLDDTRLTSAPEMAPYLDTVADAYGTNNLYPAMPCLMNNGSVVAVVLHGNRTDLGAGATTYNSVYAYRWVNGSLAKAVAAAPVEAFEIATSGRRHDLSFPVGADTDGETVYAIFFSSDADYDESGDRTDETSLDVVEVTPSGQSVVLSTLVPQRYCRNITNSRFGCVRYIGNGRYVFPASDQTEVQPGVLNRLGDLVLMVYDSKDNSVGALGAVLPDIQYRTNLYIGAIDCPVLEVAGEAGVRPATILVTFGGIAQGAASVGTEAGQTYVSYDSGQTWSILAEYGSPAGVYYCGTLLKGRGQQRGNL